MESDQQLVEDVLACVPGAFERLVKQYQKLVWHLVYRMVNDVEDTRELSQDVFLTLHRRLSQFRFESTLSTWIGRIAFHRVARHLQRKRLAIMNDSLDESLGSVQLGIAADFDLEAACADAELMQHMRRAIERLPPLQRTLITLYHLDELSIAEVAVITDLPAGTVKNYLFRARLRLREQLEQHLGVRP